MPVIIKKSKSKKKKQTKQSQPTKRELTRLGGALRALGGLAGGAIGSTIGFGGAGASAGTSLGASISRWLGSGDYKVSTNSIVNRSLKSSDGIPSMHCSSQTIVVRHKEFVTEVRGNTSFTVQNSFSINPGNTQLFPWLSSLAAKFQEYRIKGLVFHYVPSSGAISSGSSALGTVMMQTSYRASDSQPLSKSEMLNEYWSSESVPSEPFCHPIECDPKENPFNVQYVRTKNPPSGDSILMYDLGMTHIATSGQQTTGTVLGDLWATYEIELKKPQVQSSVTTPYSSGSIFFSGGSITSSDLFNGGVTKYGPMDLDASVRTLNLPVGLSGYYYVTLHIPATTTFSAVDLSGTIMYINCSAANLTPTGTTYYRTTLAGTTPTLNQAFAMYAIYIPDPNYAARLTFGLFLLTGAATTCQVHVTPYIVE